MAIGLGYRHINCAAVYGNEARIGGVLASAFSGTAGYAAVARQDLWITSKLWNDMHAPERARISVRKTLADLRLKYLDLYLVYWPLRNFHPPGCDVSSRSPDATPYVPMWRTRPASTMRSSSPQVSINLSRIDEIVFDQTYSGFRSSPFGAHIDL